MGTFINRPIDGKDKLKIMHLEFPGFHPKDAHNKVMLILTDTGVEYLNLDTQAFLFIAYRNIAGYSGWIPNYGSIHIYSNNSKLNIHLNFGEDVAENYLKQIREVLQEQTSY